MPPCKDENTAHHDDQYFYLEINWITIIGTSFKHNSCESADGRSKHSIYRDVIEIYARIWLLTTNLKTCIL